MYAQISRANSARASKTCVDTVCGEQLVLTLIQFDTTEHPVFTRCSVVRSSGGAVAAFCSCEGNPEKLRLPSAREDGRHPSRPLFQLVQTFGHRRVVLHQCGL
jgi:hypothetical protein